MKINSIIKCLIGLGVAGVVYSQAQQLKIDVNFKSNGNKLFVEAESHDHYVATAWIEGPYDPKVPCSIVNGERQNIKLVKVLNYYKPVKENHTDPAWAFLDYNTPDFIAALVTGGRYWYKPSFDADYSQSTLAPTNAKRRDQFTNGPVYQDGGIIYQRDGVDVYPLGDNSKIGDGVTSATIKGAGKQTITWDLKDASNKLIQEGNYLVYVQLSAERYDAKRTNPRDFSYNITSGGKELVNIETCWDNTAHNTLGTHRVTKLLNFGKTGFTETLATEYKYSADPYTYLAPAGVVITYTPGAISPVKSISSQKFGKLKYQVSANKEVSFNYASENLQLSSSNVSLQIVDLKGKVMTQLVPSKINSGTVSWNWKGTNSQDQNSTGMYVAKLIHNGKTLSKTQFLLK